MMKNTLKWRTKMKRNYNENPIHYANVPQKNVIVTSRYCKKILSNVIARKDTPR